MRPKSWRACLIISLIFVMLQTLAIAADPKAKLVQVTIDFGDGAELRFTSIAWREGMTGLEVLAAVQAHPRGVKFEHRGSMATALVTKIGDLKNQGSGKTSKNWLYWVNDKSADVGIGSYQPQAGDVILWRFTLSDYNSQ